MKRKRNKLNKQQSIALLFFVFLLFFLIDLSLPDEKPAVPSDGEILFLSNETGHNLSKTITGAIDSAQESIVLSIYCVSDKKVIASLNKKAEEGIPIFLYTDANASWPQLKFLHQHIKTHLWKKGALMHQKILIIDKNEVYLGSANFTWNSLNLHRNLILAFKNEDAADFLADHLESTDLGLKSGLNSARTINVGGQGAEIWMFPSNEDRVKKVLKLIQGAEKSIKVAMYTWTRTDFASALANAKIKGVDVEVVLDRCSEKKGLNPVTDILGKGLIAARIYQGPGLLHHKFVWIDDSTLLSGSANWTKAAFTQNRECTILLKDLTETQKKTMDTLWKSLKNESKSNS